MTEDRPRRFEDVDFAVGGVECTLDVERAERRADRVEDGLVHHIEAAEELENGYRLVFERTTDAFEAAAELFWLESQCCADEDFAITLPADGQPFWVDMTGPEGTKELARQGFFEAIEGAPTPE